MKMIRLFPLLFIAAVSCKNQEQPSGSFTAFEGARIIDGSGSNPIDDGVILVQTGRIVAIGSRDEIDVPDNAARIDLTGKTIVPGFINGHGHVGDTKGIDGGHYSAENIRDNLAIYASYGITTVVSLGGNRAEAESIRAINDTTSTQHARLFIAGEVITGETPDEAVAVIERNHQMGVDFMKIRVDDNLGTAKKMSEEVYRAVISRAHALGYKIATHMFYLEDARKLLEAGSDMLAHSVRDQPVDEAFINLLKQKNVGYCPTLTRELVSFVYEDTAEFLSDPFFLREYDSVTTQPLKDPVRQQQVRENKSAQTYKKQLPTAKANLKTLCDQGIPIVFGTDSGIPTRFMGYFEHLEMAMMEDAGLTPMQIIVSATKNPAQYLGLKDLGTLSRGHWADFIVLDADPLADIENVRSINSVFIGGEEVVR
jgi:imidazolonepropionase-like amidohydrolase